MKFSSISLIAAALAASSAIAAPGPLHGRALAVVDNLFGRGPVDYKELHRDLSKRLKKVARDRYDIARYAEGMAATGGKKKDDWLTEAKDHYEIGLDRALWSQAHKEESKLQPTHTSLRDHIDAHNKLVEEDAKVIAERMKSMKGAGYLRQHRKVAKKSQLEPVSWPDSFVKRKKGNRKPLKSGAA